MAEALLPKPPRYRSHIAWLLKRKTDDERFWRGYLKGFEQRTSIEAAPQSGPALTSERRHYTSRTIDAETLHSMTSAAKASRVTLNTLFQAAWALVLGRYAASDDVVFGVVSSGRSDGVTGIERMVGLLVTTTPMRVQIRDRDTVRSLLRRLQDEAATSRQHEHAPLTKIQSWSDMAPGEAMFDCLYVFGNFPPPKDVPGASLRVQSVDIRAPSTFPLAILIDPDSRGGVVVSAVTDPSRYADSLARQLVDAVITTVETLADDLDAPVTSIDSLPTAERQKLDTWSFGGKLEPPWDDVVDAIDDIATRRPDALAVAGQGNELTYGALLERARSAASSLTSLGVEAGDPVIVQIDRGPKAVIGILAILLAGGAYVPLDPVYPRARRAAMVEDSKARIIVTAGDGTDGFEQLQHVDLDAVKPTPPAGWVRPKPPPNTPAYIIYTSGSSGRPKGVVVSRANLAFSNAARRAFYEESPEAFLLLSSLSFDSSVVGLFWTLSTGGALVVAGHRIEQDVERVAALIDHYGVTHLLCLPSLHGVLVEHADLKRLASLRVAIVAGETCPPSLPARHRKALPTARLFNEYGPTEATVWCIASDITDTPEDQNPAIGRPIPGTTVRLVDHRSRPVPRGVAGELMIGGPGVALGYHGHADLTVTRFQTLPGEGGVRFYRTGDFARWQTDGRLDFLGRRDGQLKIRGHRIEVHEIEAALERAPTIRAAAVVVVPNDGQGARLAAFVEGDQLDLETVRQDLAKRLPDAMLPSVFTALPALPRLPNGKVDRVQLTPKANAEIRQGPTDQFATPTNPAESMLVAIWQKVLKVPEVGIRDDFFALGGDSLSSIRIVSLARREGLDIKPTSVLEFPTIEALVRSMNAPEQTHVAVGKTSKAPFFMIQGGKRMRDYLQDALGDHCAVHLLEDHWDDGFLSPLTSVDGMAEDYLAQLRGISPKGPYRLGGFSIGAAASVVMAQRLMDEGEEVEILFLLDPPDNMAFIGGVHGLDPETLKALSLSQASNEDPFGRPKIQGHGRLAWIARLSDFIQRKYYRYVRGPLRLLQGSAAFYLGRKLPPHAASHYAWIVYNFAIQRHRLSPYAGRLLVFRSVLGRDLGQHYLWKELAQGAYEEEHFRCEHISFRRDAEIVKAWTERLAAKLRETT